MRVCLMYSNIYQSNDHISLSKLRIHIKSQPFTINDVVRLSMTEVIIGICAVTFDFQQCGCLASVDSDKPVQHPFRHRNSK